MDLTRLRGETRSQHEAVEALLPLTSPQLTRGSYSDLLVCMYTVVSTWETWAEAHAPTALASLVSARKREGLLRSDLEFLGRAVPASTASNGEHRTFPPNQGTEQVSEAAFLGMMYVMEGSTLGGQYIARHVERTLGLEPGEGNAYFRGYGEQTGAMWRAFQKFLRDLPEDSAEEVIAAAQTMFTYFEQNMRFCLAATSLCEVL